MFGRMAVVALTVVAQLGPVIASDSRGAGEQAPANETERFRSWVTGPAGYLLSAKEKKIADALLRAGSGVTSENLTAFRHWFWERRDPSRGTITNEFRNAFEKRVDYVNKEYGGELSSVPGWTTPKGLVYVMLGPPTEIQARSGRPYGAVDDSAVELWIYQLDDGPVLELPFVDREGRAVLLTTPDNLGMRRRLDEALARAAVGSIRERDTPFTGASPLTSARAAPGLPATGSAALRPDGIEAQISVPLSELYGRPRGDDLRIDLRFELRDADGSGTEPPSDVTMIIQPHDFERWAERRVTVVAWLPDTRGVDNGSAVVVTEVPSGRSVALELGDRAATSARAYPVEHLLGGASDAAGGGTVFAFIARDPTDTIPPNSLWVVRAGRDVAGMLVEESVGNLFLAHR